MACTIAQMEREGGISPRMSPLAQVFIPSGLLIFRIWCFSPDALHRTFVKVRDAGNLLTRAGFTLPGVDVDQYTVRYNSG